MLQSSMQTSKAQGPLDHKFESPDVSKPHLPEGKNDAQRDSDFPRLVAERGLEGLPREDELL